MSDMTVANEILRQLGGGGRLKAMIGAKNFMGDDKSLTFRFAAHASNGSNCIRVTLDWTDTYIVEFISVRGMSVKTKGLFSNVYADNLRSLIESETGLYLSLGTMGGAA